MSKRFIANFRHGEGGRLLAERPGFNRYLVFPDRANQESPKPYTKYVVEITNDFPARRYCFVRIVESVAQIWTEIEPTLLTATWQPGQDIFSDPWTEIKSPKRGLIKVKFCDTKGRLGIHRYAYVTLHPDSDDDNQLSFEVGTDVASLDALAAMVRRQGGPQADLAAVISRQCDSRTGRTRWRR